MISTFYTKYKHLPFNTLSQTKFGQTHCLKDSYASRGEFEESEKHLYQLCFTLLGKIKLKHLISNLTFTSGVDVELLATLTSFALEEILESM